MIPPARRSPLDLAACAILALNASPTAGILNIRRMRELLRDPSTNELGAEHVRQAYAHARAAIDALPARLRSRRIATGHERKHMVEMGLRVDPETFEEIRALAAKNDQSVSETVRQLIEWGLEAARGD